MGIPARQMINIGIPATVIMKAWVPGILALGVIAIAAGSVMAVLKWHRSIGLIGVGVGVILVLGGLVMTVRGRKGVVVEASKVSTATKPKGGYFKPLVAILIVVGIGVGTFYGTSYLASIQPGGGVTSVSSTSSSVSGAGTSSTSSGSGGSTSSVSSATTSNTGSSSTSQGTQTSGQTQNTTSVTQSSSHSSTVNESFVSSTAVSITPSGANVTLSGAFVNRASSSIIANVYITTFFGNGTEFFSGVLYYPHGLEVLQGKELTISKTLGPFAPGKYVAEVYLVDPTLQQISQITTVSFTIT
jgi:hypothetical protein